MRCGFLLVVMFLVGILVYLWSVFILIIYNVFVLSGQYTGDKCLKKMVSIIFVLKLKFYFMQIFQERVNTSLYI